MGKALGCPQAAAVGDQKIGSLSFLHCFGKAATGASFGRRSYGLAWRKETQLRITVLDGELAMVAFVYPSFLSSLFLFFVIDLRCTIARRLLNVAMGLLSGQQQKEWLSDTVDEVGPTTQTHTHTAVSLPARSSKDVDWEARVFTGVYDDHKAARADVAVLPMTKVWWSASLR